MPVPIHIHIHIHKLVRLTLAAAALATAATSNARSPLATYEGADRLPRLIEAAKKEGTLTLYTTIAEKDVEDRFFKRPFSFPMAPRTGYPTRVCRSLKVAEIC